MTVKPLVYRSYGLRKIAFLFEFNKSNATKVRFKTKTISQEITGDPESMTLVLSW